MLRQRLISCCEWVILFAVGATDFYFTRTTDIPLSIPNNIIETVLFITALWPLITILTKVTGFARGSEVIAENAAKFFIFVITVSALEYYLAANPAPLEDTLLISIDHMLGFSWPAFFDWVMTHKPIGKILGYFYMSLEIQAVFVLFAIGIFFPRRANRFVTAFLISSLGTLLIFSIFPVEGPFVYFHHTDLGPAYYTAHYLGMRDHTLKSIPLDDIRGIVSFPSFHVSSAVVITYFFRQISYVFPLVVLLNIGMSISALVIGGHYLCDVLAGALVGFVTIGLIHLIEGPDPEIRLPSGLKRRR